MLVTTACSEKWSPCRAKTLSRHSGGQISGDCVDETILEIIPAFAAM